MKRFPAASLTTSSKYPDLTSAIVLMIPDSIRLSVCAAFVSSKMAVFEDVLVLVADDARRKNDNSRVMSIIMLP